MRERAALCTGRQRVGAFRTNSCGRIGIYVRASVLGTGIEVYIYEDEAQFHRDGKRAGVFEHQDFGDSDQLQKAFICAVLEAADDT